MAGSNSHELGTKRAPEGPAKAEFALTGKFDNVAHFSHPKIAESILWKVLAILACYSEEPFIYANLRYPGAIEPRPSRSRCDVSPGVLRLAARGSNHSSDQGTLAIVGIGVPLQLMRCTSPWVTA